MILPIVKNYQLLPMCLKAIDETVAAVQEGTLTDESVLYGCLVLVRGILIEKGVTMPNSADLEVFIKNHSGVTRLLK